MKKILLLLLLFPALYTSAQQSVSLGWRGGASYLSGNNDAIAADPNFSSAWAAQCNMFVRYNINSKWQLESGLFHSRSKYNNSPTNLQTSAEQSTNYYQVPVLVNYYPSIALPSCMKSCPVMAKIQPYIGLGYLFTVVQTKTNYEIAGETGPASVTSRTSYTIPFTARIQQGFNMPLCHNWYFNAEGYLNMSYRKVNTNGASLNDTRINPGITAGFGIQF